MTIFKQCILIGGLSIAVSGPTLADPHMVSADRILGVYGTDEYGENDWNDDDITDLAVIAISESGDAVDLFLATSDPATAEMRVTDIAYNILPYDPQRANTVSYDIGPGHEIYEPHISYLVEDGKQLFFSVNARAENAGVMSILTYGPRQDDGSSTVICEFNSVDIYGTDAPPSAMVRGPDGVETQFSPGPEPLLRDWHYTDLPAVCLP